LLTGRARLQNRLRGKRNVELAFRARKRRLDERDLGGCEVRRCKLVGALDTIRCELRLGSEPIGLGRRRVLGPVEMLGYLPVIFFGAAVPGPMHSVAIVLWVLLFPDRPGEMTAFGFAQHNFFVLFNAATGLLFLRRATRELFAEAP